MNGLSVSVADVAQEPPEGWDALTVQPPGGHVMQGTTWALHRRDQGADAHFVRFTDGCGALVTTRRRPPLPGSVAYARRGPVSAGDPPERIAERAAALAEWLRGEGAASLSVDPQLEASPAYEAAMTRHGFSVGQEVEPSIHVMRLTFPPGADADRVLAGVSKPTRQRIRAAERAGTTVRVDQPGEWLEEFGTLLAANADRKQFFLRPELGFISWWRRLLAAGQGRLFVAERHGELLGALLVYLQGGCYATAFSADRVELRREFPGTMHLVRWTAIREALESGAPAINLGGVDLPGYREPPRPGQPNWGLYEHKASFGAEWVVQTPLHRIVLRPWADRVNRAAHAVAALRRSGLRRAAGGAPGAA